MLKKFTILTLLTLYSFASWGLSIHLFYCCGKLESVSLKAEQHEGANCPVKKKTTNCCDKKALQVKVSDDQRNNSFEPVHVPYPEISIITPPAFFTLDAVDFENLHSRFSVTDSSPPIIDRPVLFNVFRI